MQGTPLMRSEVVITNSKGSNAPPVAEYVLFLMLGLAKLSRRLADAQARHFWDRDATPEELLGRTVAIVGLGSIGEEVAKRCKPFGMRVIGSKRSVTSRGTGSQHVDELFPPDQLHAMLGEADYVVLAMPLTPETQGMIDAAAIAAMKPGARVINIARGGVVDDAALVDGLRSGHLGGAGLDVFNPEPLPEDSPYWDLPNVIVTPHRSGLTQNTRAYDIFVENLGRWLRSEPLVNVVNKDLGY
jgi:phosphoglycerate dehydrogenase-like enzyme